MMQLHPTDCLGYAASAAVLATFALREMRALRLMAIGSNVLFMWYAHRVGLGPVLLLHSLLLPLNAFRLYQALHSSACAPAHSSGGTNTGRVNERAPPRAPVA